MTNPLEVAVARADALTRPRTIARVPDVRPRLDRDDDDVPETYWSSLYGGTPANIDRDADDVRPNPEHDGREVVADPLVELRAAGALVGYQALVDATAVPPVSIWVQGIEADSHIEISGPSGHGKTSLALLMMIARANPTGKAVNLLGYPMTPGAPGTFVVHIQEENGKHSIRQKTEIGCEALGLPVRETLDRMIFLVRRGVMAGDRVWQSVEALGRAGRISMIVVDSRARVLRQGESNKEEDQALVANLLHRLIEASGAPVVVVSHTRKGQGGAEPSEIEDISGSLQRGAGADVALIVTAKKDDAGKVTSAKVKFAKLREVVDDHPEPVTFVLTKDVTGRWTLSTDVVEVAAKDDRPAAERVADALAAQPVGLTKGAIRSALSMNGATLEQALSALFADGRITREQRVVGGKVRDVFRVRGGQ